MGGLNRGITIFSSGRIPVFKALNGSSVPPLTDFDETKFLCSTSPTACGLFWKKP